ncbi:kinase-like protein [Annulohypoxylon truncatum]|uniref:kinase-like protein n=1 Tax=Annulohypoxylon truncatum TaxID=327061 RepID=UPI002007BBA5|nr:kinase-like protein [Annulohypoxylon truncatum]KAI1213377.1 kinase-like protein [Annulohypoxylon truncatum]
MSSDIESTCELLKERFDRDARFHYRKLIASGSYGSAHHVRYTDPSRPDLTDFLVKKAFGNRDAMSMMRSERQYLTRLRGAKHIVKILNIENNPLVDDPEAFSIRRNSGTGEWIILEWIPNGTMADFIVNASDLGVEYLPNRLLWRFFFCLVRACCGLAWPNNRTDDLVVDEVPVPGVPPSGIEHKDLHHGNILMGDFLPEPEHGISPIVKFVDFGLAGEWTFAHGAYRHGVARNVWDIGQAMVKFITMNPYIRVSRPGEGQHTEINHMGVRIETMATAILPVGSQGGPNPWLDDDLTFAVARCLASDPGQRPNLHTLFAWCSLAANRGEDHYRGVATETDAVVKSLCQEIITGPPRR